MIAEMARLELLCLRTRLDEMTAFLQEQGLLHVEHVPLAVENAPNYLHRVRLTETQKAEAKALRQLDEILREIAPLLTGKPDRGAVERASRGLADMDLTRWRKSARGWSRELRSLTRRRANVQDDIEVLANYRNVLQTIEPATGSDRAVLGRNARVAVLNDESDRGLAALRKRLRRDVDGTCNVHHRRMSKTALVVLVLFPEDQAGAAAGALAREGIAPFEVLEEDLQGRTAPQALDELEVRLAEHRATLDALADKIEAFSQSKGAQLLAMRAAAADRLAQLEVLDNFAVSEMTAVVHGWAPADHVESFENALTARFGAEAVMARLPMRDVDPRQAPTLLRNAPSMEPFEVLLSLFKPAAYGSYDPTVFVGVFFVGFYGFILGDLGYGLILLAAAWLLKRRFGHIAWARRVTLVAMYCGAAAAVFGVLFGEFFGDLGHSCFNMPHLWFHRGHDTERLLMIAVVIGAVHIVLSLVLAVREGLRHRDHRHAAEKLGLLLGLLGVAVAACSYLDFWPFGAASATALAALLIILSAALLIRASGFMAPVQMLEVVSLVSNVLSYSRLMALGLASVILADIANEMGSKAGNVVLGVAVAGLMHAVNLAIGVFSPTLHSLRLNYVEFLPKFYLPEGRVYEPFRKETL